MSALLNVAALGVTDWATGPGRYLTLWLRGCSVRCSVECVNRALWDAEGEPRQWLSTEDVLALLNADLEGVCASGGEPLDQAEPLARLAGEVRARGFGMVAYSGRTLEALRSGAVPGAAALLAQLDILIDGPYIPALAGAFLWRGSGNQRVHLLTKRYGPEVLRHAPVTNVSLAEGQSVVVGTPNRGLERLLAELQARGVQVAGDLRGTGVPRP